MSRFFSVDSISCWHWELKRYAKSISRKFEITSWIVLGSIVSCFGFWLAEQVAQRSLMHLSVQIGAKQVAYAAPQTTRSVARARLAAFEKILLPSEDIPVAIQDLLRLAQDGEVSVVQADYRLEVDSAGQFLQYRMTWPLKGSSPSVHRFIAKALKEQPSLAVESIQFKRDKDQNLKVDARIQWLIYAKLPTNSPSINGIDVRGKDQL